MTKENVLRFYRIYKILLSAVIVIAGICFIAGCISIYLSGDSPYSREIVAETFGKIAIPVYLCLVMTIIGFILDIVLPAECKADNKKNTSKRVKPTEALKLSDKALLILRISLLVIGLALLIFGFISGGTADVITKAINICTECIGLG